MAADRKPKNQAEGATFSAAVLPLVHYCNPTAAANISSELKFHLTEYKNGTSPVLNFTAVKLAFEETYPCLGITCAAVGALKDTAGKLLHTKTAACGADGTRDPIAGYISRLERGGEQPDRPRPEGNGDGAEGWHWRGGTHWFAVGGNSLSKG